MGDYFNSQGPLLQTKLGNWITVEDAYNAFGQDENTLYVQRLMSGNGEQFIDGLMKDIVHGQPNKTVAAQYKSDAATRKSLPTLDKDLQVIHDVIYFPQRCAEATGPNPAIKKQSPLVGSFGSS